ncbi:MAG: hypothetical protein ABDH59_02790 [Fervidobacterium sp.]
MDSRKRKLFILFFGLMSTLIVFSNSLEIALEGVSLLKKSKDTLFPLNILFYYVGISQLSNAVSSDPTNLDIRLVRASAIFDFVENNPIAQDIVQEDLEFFLLFKDRYKYSSKISLDVVYYMLCYVYGLKKDYPKMYFYLDKLSKEQQANTFIEKLKLRFPKIVNK